MQITNKTRKTAVAARFKLCRSVASKAKGLMFTNETCVNEAALLFEFKRPMMQSLHMFFVFYPIDVLFLDENKKVLDVKERFKPFTVYNSLEKSKYVIELPSGAVKRSRTSKGDVLAWR
jgi:hypothetical protein